MAGPVSQWVVEHVKRVLREESLVVWFDPEGYYQELLAQIQEAHCTIIPYQGSYYEMRRQAEAPFDQMTAAARAMGSNCLLLYVPRPEREAEPLLEFTLAGKNLTVVLRQAALGGLRGQVPEATIDQFLSSRRPSVADLDGLAQSGNGSLLTALFGTASEVEMASQYLSDRVWQERIDQRQAFGDLLDLCRSAFGLTANADNHKELQAALLRHLLLAELRAGVQAQPSALANIPAPTEQQTQRVGALLVQLRQFHSDLYRDAARRGEAETGVAGWGIPAAELRNLDTFPCLEQAALLETERLALTAGDLTTALALAQRGLHSFWVRDDEQRSRQWKAAELALALCQEAARVQDAVKPLNGVTPATLVSSYTDVAQGWWRLDAVQRRLEAHLADMEEEFALEDLKQQARHRHEEAIRLLAERMDGAVQTHGFQFGAHPHQTDVYSRWVEPHLARGERVAYFLVDAMRFEMGRELLDSLSGLAAQELTACIATPPTITPVGMAALMPGAEKGVTLTVKGNDLALQVDGQVLGALADRQSYLVSRVGAGAVCDLTLDELLDLGDAKLRTAVQHKSLVVVRSQEIDEQGEQQKQHQAKRTMSRVLKDVKQGINRLRKLGITRVVLVADHGHLFGREYGADMKVARPSGQEIELDRRCWVGRHATAPNGTVAFKASSLGLGGELEFVFPRGLAIFGSAGGSRAYFHGGLSLQELVVPVLSLELAPIPKADNSQKLDIVLNKERVTNRALFLQLQYSSLVDLERRVRLVVLKGQEEVGEVLTADDGFDAETQEVRLLSQKPITVCLKLNSELDGQGDLNLQVVDARTGLVLADRKLPYELL